jgi:hypothetical protein
MRWLLAIILLIFFNFSYACTGYVLGFAGLGNAFDTKAFNAYAKYNSLCKKVFTHEQEKLALEWIKKHNKPYELYGFSAGAATVGRVMRVVTKQNLNKPIRLITLGAYRTTNVDFTKYNVPFINLFDVSGRGQKSPGFFVQIPHMQIQRYFNEADQE